MLITTENDKQVKKSIKVHLKIDFRYEILHVKVWNEYFFTTNLTMLLILRHTLNTKRFGKVCEDTATLYNVIYHWQKQNRKFHS